MVQYLGVEDGGPGGAQAQRSVDEVRGGGGRQLRQRGREEVGKAEQLRGHMLAVVVEQRRRLRHLHGSRTAPA